MVRLSRAQQQERTRLAVLAAAHDEFAEHGYLEAKVDRIAERAELTRGAVYSNFPSKRALYLAVLIDLVERVDDHGVQASPATPAQALGQFARVWLERLPLVDDPVAHGQLRLRSLSGVVENEPALAEVARLEAQLLALALSAGDPHAQRRVRLAELALTLLAGVGRLAESAPGFGDPFDVVRACEHLAGIDFADAWDPPHLRYIARAQPTSEAWTPPTTPMDLLSGQLARLADDGVIAVLGSRHLGAAEEAIRGARSNDRITVAVVTSDPAELGRLVRLRLGDLVRCLGRVFTPDTWSRVQLVLDEQALIASALGVSSDDDTEAAVRVHNATIVARASGRGAAYAAASAVDRPKSPRTSRTTR